MLTRPTAAGTLGSVDGLEGKVAVVTGGASGIGQALAVAYAHAGVRTVVGYYPGDPHDVDVTLERVAAAGGDSVACPVDVRRPEQLEALAQMAVDDFGRLDIAVANAGAIRRTSLAELTEQAWNESIGVNLSGAMYTLQSAARRMSGPGAMVLVSSIAGGVFGTSHLSFAAAKAGGLGLCRALAMELASRQIRVNAVLPGLVRTPQTMDRDNSIGPARMGAAAAQVPLGRIGDPDDVAQVIKFLTSDGSRYITGQQLVVDGGLAVRWPLSDVTSP
jgi:3-oxoacyl-[acyl-carrier protein] reductase